MISGTILCHNDTEVKLMGTSGDRYLVKQADGTNKYVKKANTSIGVCETSKETITGDKEGDYPLKNRNTLIMLVIGMIIFYAIFFFKGMG